MIELRKLRRAAIPAALAKAERYRLLNEAWEAESISRDILAVDPSHQEAKVLLILALSDQFAQRVTANWDEANVLAASLSEPHKRVYYRGILYERRAKASLQAGRAGPHHSAYEDLNAAMRLFAEAAESAPAGDESAVLRWNTCARILNSEASLQPAADSAEPPTHD